MAHKTAVRPCAESDDSEIWRHDGRERPLTKLLFAQTPLLDRGWRALRPSEVLRFCSNRANSYRATCLTRASLAVAVGKHNDGAIRRKICSTIFTKPGGSMIVAAVAFRSGLSFLPNFVCTIVAAPLLCVAAENAAHQNNPEA